MTGPRYLKLVGAAAVVLAFFFLARMLPLARWIDVFQEWAQGLGLIGMVVFAGVYAIAAVFMVPGSILTLAGGAAFGVLPGFVTVLCGATLGATLAFLAARHLARHRIEGWIRSKPKFAAVDEAVAREGGKIVFLTRLSPIFPFNFQNYAYGLTKVSFGRYVMATLIGMIPGTFLYVYLGSLGRRSLEAAAGAESVEGLRFALQVLGLAATIAATIIITRTARRYLKEAGV